MSSRIPPAPDLVEAAADYLESQVLPTLQGYHRFQTRIAVNVLRCVMRECRLASAHDDAEHERLRQLLGRDGALDSLRGEPIETLTTLRMESASPMRTTCTASPQSAPSRPSWLGWG